MKASKTIVLFFFCWFAACSEDEWSSVDPYPYQAPFPISLNTEYLYIIDSLVYDNFKKDSFSSSKYQLEKVVDVFDSVPWKIYRLEIFQKDSMHHSWSYVRTDKMGLGSNYYTRSSNNQRILYLRFPLLVGSRWDGNLFNSSGRRSFTLVEKGKNLSFQDSNYNFFRVERTKIINPYQNFTGAEIYLESVGLYRQEIIEKELQFGYYDGFKLTKQLIGFKK